MCVKYKAEFPTFLHFVFGFLLTLSSFSFSVVPFCHYAIDANTSNKLWGQLNKVCMFVRLSFHFVGNSSPTRNDGKKKRDANESRFLFYATNINECIASMASAQFIRLYAILCTLECKHFCILVSFIQCVHCRMKRAKDEKLSIKCLLYGNNVSSF